MRVDQPTGRWRRHRCPLCGWRYRDHRSERTWRDVRAELRAEHDRKRVSRGTILGRWHEHKLLLWRAMHGRGQCVADS